MSPQGGLVSLSSWKICLHHRVQRALYKHVLNQVDFQDFQASSYSVLHDSPLPPAASCASQLRGLLISRVYTVTGWYPVVLEGADHVDRVGCAAAVVYMSDPQSRVCSGGSCTAVAQLHM
jgi:hypothetical protein